MTHLRLALKYLIFCRCDKQMGGRPTYPKILMVGAPPTQKYLWWAPHLPQNTYGGCPIMILHLKFKFWHKNSGRPINFHGRPVNFHGSPIKIMGAPRGDRLMPRGVYRKASVYL